MAKIKTSLDEREIERFKNTNFTFSFQRFKNYSTCSNEITFNNNYMTTNHFLKTNSDFIEAMKILSNETYNSTIVTKKFFWLIYFVCFYKTYILILAQAFCIVNTFLDFFDFINKAKQDHIKSAHEMRQL